MEKHKWNAESIKNLRSKYNLKQAQIAEELGCRSQTVSEWEMGKYAPKNAYIKLLDMFEKKMDEQNNFLVKK